MARTKKTDTTEVVASTTAETTVETATSNDTVLIACGLAIGIKFDDVDNGNGGTKTVKFPGINYSLRGATGGILSASGNAVLVRVDKADWENIKKKHGKERIFTAVPPLLQEYATEDAFRAEKKGAIAEMKTGVDPVSPEAEGVEKAK